VTGTVSKSGDYSSDKNGNVTGSLTLTPPPSTSALACRDDQIPLLAKVTYSQVEVGSPSLGSLPISGTYSKVLEPNCKCLWGSSGGGRNRTHRTGITRPTRFEDEGAHQAPVHLHLLC
jgi:hypothetical protein